MNNERSIQEWQRPLAFLAEAPLGWLIAHGQTRHFAAEAPVVAGDSAEEWAYLVLSGSCHLRQDSEGKSGTEIVRTFKRGETFGSFLKPGCAMAAAEGSMVFCIRLRDLADIVPKINGHHSILADTSDTTRFTITLNAPRGRLTTLAFFSAGLPDQLLAENIARRLHSETGESVLLVHSAASAGSAADYVPDGGFALPSEIRAVEDGFWRLRIKVPHEPPSPEHWSEVFRSLCCRFDHVLLDVEADRVPARMLADCITQSRAAYFFLRRHSEDLYHLDLLLHELRPAWKGLRTLELNSVLCLAENEAADGFDAQIEKTGISRQFFIRRCPVSGGGGMTAGIFAADLRRVARGIGNCLVGLALSSGAAKGFAHIGVLQVLEENGLEPDIVAGSSMGAYVGAVWAFGCDGEKMEMLAREMEIKWALWNLIDPVFPPRQGFLRGYAVKRRLQKTIGDVQFADLVRPLRVLAANLDTLERVVFSSGDVATAVHTSIAVPGIFVPVRLGDNAFVDGGIVDPLPTDVLQEMGVKKIIAVNAIPTFEHIRDSLLSRRARKLERQTLSVNERVNYFARGNILEILMHSIHGAQIRMAQSACRRASVVLQPDVGDDRWLDFRNPGQYIAAGRAAALRQLEEIKALVQRKETAYETRPATEPMVAAA